jgi:large subunit ribosomal protein L19e
MTNKLQKRLAAELLGCGANRVWLDPTENNEISLAKSRDAVRKLIKDEVIIRKPIVARSRFAWRKRKEAIRKGRHTGIGKRRGARNARNPSKRQWMLRQRVLRKVLRKYREVGRIDNHLYKELYLKAKGNVYKSKKTLMESVFKAKAEQVREQRLVEQLKAKKEKQQKLKEQKVEREERRSKRQIQEADKAAKLSKEDQSK